MKRFSTIFLILLAALMILTVQAFAAEEVASDTCGDALTWTLDSDGVLTISGTGAMKDYSYSASSSAPWYDYRSSIKKAVIADGVTTIGDYAFYGCSSLITIALGDSVTTIGNSAFDNCISLTTIDIPDSVTTIDDYAFANCTSLTTIALGDSVRTIGEFALEDCTSLISIDVDANNAFYSSKDGVLFNKNQTELVAFPCGIDGEYVIPDTVTTIGFSAFDGCTSLTTIEIPNSVTKIGRYAFRYCTSLTAIDIPDSVTKIDDLAFSHCRSLSSIDIPDSVTTIGYSTFYDCDSLTTVTLGDSVKTIGNSAFDNCISLTTIDIPDSVTTIDDYAFANCTSLRDVYYAGSSEQWTAIFVGSGNGSLTSAAVHFPDQNIGGTCGTNVIWTLDSDGVLTISGTGAMRNYSLSSFVPWYNYRSSVKKVVIEAGVTTISNYVFSYCTSLTTIDIPDSVTTIDYSAFSNCTSLTAIKIPDSVTTIAVGTFSGCHSLLEVTIPASVTTIGDVAFYDCYSLTDVFYNGTREQWAKIKIGSDNTSLIPANIHFVDGIYKITSLQLTDGSSGALHAVCGVKCHDAVDGYALAAIYDANGRQLGMALTRLIASDGAVCSVTFDFAGAANAACFKVFVVAKDFVPLGASASEDLTA